jgi:hypothetical protein
MAKTIYDPNPHLSILEGDGQVKKQIAEQAKRALDMAQRQREAPPLSAEQIKAERFQYESNEHAAQNPLYAAARSTSAHFLVVPLDKTEPLVRPADATRDAWQIFQWWSTWPEGPADGPLGTPTAGSTDWPTDRPSDRPSDRPGTGGGRRTVPSGTARKPGRSLGRACASRSSSRRSWMPS